MARGVADAEHGDHGDDKANEDAADVSRDHAEQHDDHTGIAPERDPLQVECHGRIFAPLPGSECGARHDGPMTAYWISSYVEITDEAKLAAYAELAAPALTAAGGTFIVRGLPGAVYEAGRDLRTVVIEFASVSAATAAHDSADYQAALVALDGGAVRDIRIVEGV